MSFKQIIKKIRMHVSAKLKSLKYDIGSRCQFENVSFLAEKNTIKIGNRVMIYRETEVCATREHPVTIGDGVFINQQCIIRPGTNIGDNVSIGPKSTIVTDTHELGDGGKRAGKNIHLPISIGNGTWIGANVTILAGVTIGSGVVVAAGAVVTKDVEDNVLVAGVPAKVIKTL